MGKADKKCSFTNAGTGSFVHVYGWFSRILDNTLIDLHVVTPDGEHAWYGNTVLKNSGGPHNDVTTG